MYFEWNLYTDRPSYVLAASLENKKQQHPSKCFSLKHTLVQTLREISFQQNAYFLHRRSPNKRTFVSKSTVQYKYT